MSERIPIVGTGSSENGYSLSREESNGPNGLREKGDELRMRAGNGDYISPEKSGDFVSAGETVERDYASIYDGGTVFEMIDAAKKINADILKAKDRGDLDSVDRLERERAAVLALITNRSVAVAMKKGGRGRNDTVRFEAEEEEGEDDREGSAARLTASEAIYAVQDLVADMQTEAALTIEESDMYGQYDEEDENEAGRLAEEHPDWTVDQLKEYMRDRVKRQIESVIKQTRQTVTSESDASEPSPETSDFATGGLEVDDSLAAESAPGNENEPVSSGGVNVGKPPAEPLEASSAGSGGAGIGGEKPPEEPPESDGEERDEGGEKSPEEIAIENRRAAAEVPKEFDRIPTFVNIERKTDPWSIFIQEKLGLDPREYNRSRYVVTLPEPVAPLSVSRILVHERVEAYAKNYEELARLNPHSLIFASNHDVLQYRSILSQDELKATDEYVANHPGAKRIEAIIDPRLKERLEDPKDELHALFDEYTRLKARLEAEQEPDMFAAEVKKIRETRDKSFEDALGVPDEYETPEFELEKKKHDAVHMKLYEMLAAEGVDDEEIERLISGFSIEYFVPEEEIKDKKDPSKTAGAKLRRFTNDHDLKKFRARLSPEDRLKLDKLHVKHYDGNSRNGWFKINIYATGLWEGFNDPNNPLFKHKEEFDSFLDDIVRNEAVPDAYAAWIKEEVANKGEVGEAPAPPEATTAGTPETAPEAAPEEESETESVPAEPDIAPEVLLPVAKEFEVFFNIKPEDLDRVPGYKDLTEPQRRLVLENLKQLSLGRVRDEARDLYEKELRKAGENHLFDNKYVRAAEAGIRRFLIAARKEYKVSGYEKEGAKELMDGGLAVHGSILEQVIDGTKKTGLGMKAIEGRYVIDFGATVDAGGRLTKSEKQTADAFNLAADKFSRMPYEWSLKSALESERSMYERAKAEYYRLSKDITAIRSRQNGGDTREALIFWNDLDEKIRINQFMNTHPEAEKQLLSTTNQGLIWESAKRIAKGGKTLYFSMGFAARSVSTGVWGGLGSFILAPLVAGAMGGLREFGESRERAKLSDRDTRREREGSLRVGGARKKELEEELKEVSYALSELTKEQKAESDIWKDKNIAGRIKQLERRRQKLEDDLYLGGTFVRASSRFETVQTESGREKTYEVRGLSEKIERLVARLDNIDNEVEIALKHGLFSPKQREIYENDPDRLKEKIQNDIVASLRARLKYTRKKLDQGTVSFGGGDDAERLAHQLKLFSAIRDGHEKEFGLALEAPDKDGKTKQGRIDEAVDMLVGGNEAKVTASRNRKVWQDARRAALRAAGFAFAGAAIRQAIDWYIHSSDVVKASGKGTKTGRVAFDGTKAAEGDDIGAAVKERPVAVEDLSLRASKGMTLWDEINKRLAADDNFDGLSPAQKNHAIDLIKDKFASLSPERLKELGFKSGNIDELRIGYEINLAPVMKDKGMFAAAIERAKTVREVAASAPDHLAKPSVDLEAPPVIRPAIDEVPKSGFDSGMAFSEVPEPPVEQSGLGEKSPHLSREVDYDYGVDEDRDRFLRPVPQDEALPKSGRSVMGGERVESHMANEEAVELDDVAREAASRSREAGSIMADEQLKRVAERVAEQSREIPKTFKSLFELNALLKDGLFTEDLPKIARHVESIRDGAKSGTLLEQELLVDQLKKYEIGFRSPRIGTDKLTDTELSQIRTIGKRFQDIKKIYERTAQSFNDELKKVGYDIEQYNRRVGANRELTAQSVIDAYETNRRTGVQNSRFMVWLYEKVRGAEDTGVIADDYIRGTYRKPAGFRDKFAEALAVKPLRRQ